MTQLFSTTPPPKPEGINTEIADNGTIRTGGGFRLPSEIMDSSRIRFGGGFRLPNA